MADINEKDIAKKDENECKENKVINVPKRRKNSVISLIIFSVFLIMLGCLCWFLLKKDVVVDKTDTEIKEVFSEYKMTSNSLEKFDLYFLKLENQAANKIYSPLSIKYALSMLKEGSGGNTKAQLDSVIGDYKTKKYDNNTNMSFANAIFIRNSFKANINSKYVSNLKDKYNAEVIYDSFDSAENFNKWIGNKTFNLINNLYTDDDIRSKNYILTNALAIDMEWNKPIQPIKFNDQFRVIYKHENFAHFVGSIDSGGYRAKEFNNNAVNAKNVTIGAVANKYDIVNTLGEDNIRKTVGDAYKEWLASEDSKYCLSSGSFPNDVDTYLNTYISELNSNYKHIGSSTDFSFFVDEEVKAFAKDLKTYNGTTLQYIGIMPKSVTLDNYVNDLSVEKVNSVITGLKDIKLDSFKEGVVTKITGYIPLFKFEYKLNLIEDLKKLGIVDVFDINKADLSLLSSKSKTYIEDVSHKANIEFSNVGIKAAAAIAIGGAGSTGGCFDYKYDVPVEEIDLTFNNPYMFLIRDKNTGEVWFAGTVYEPIEWQPQY